MDATSPVRDVCLRLVRDHVRTDTDALVVVVDAGSADLAVELSRACPDSHVLILLSDVDHVPEDLRALDGERCRIVADAGFAERTLRVAALPHPPTLIVEHDGRTVPSGPSSFKYLFWSLARGGRYAIRDRGVPARFTFEDRTKLSVSEILDWLERDDPHPQERARAATIVRELQAARGDVVTDSGVTIIEKTNDHVFTLRDWEADDVFTSRWGDAWGETLVRQEAYTFEPAGALTVLGSGPLDPTKRQIEVPERLLRRYHEVDLSWRLLLLKENLVLPDAFRHRHQRRLSQARLVPATARMARPLRPAGRRTLAGDFYLLDSEYSAHFGHLTTEVLGMMWGWLDLRERIPGLRPIVTCNPGMTVLPDYVLQVFAAFGIDPDEIEYVGNGEEVRVERLYAASPQMESPRWIDRAITQSWRRLGAEVLARATSPDDDGLGVEKVFVSRRPGGKRDCLNTPQVEKFFRRLGFSIYFPEDHSYAHQVSTFTQATRIAGFGGSGMFGMMFAPSARVLVLASENYTANNEYLLAAANGSDIAYVWGPAQVPARPDGLWDPAAFRSDFTIPLRRHRRAMKRFLR